MKIIRIIGYFFIIIILLSKSVYSKYVYSFNEEIIYLKREVDELKCKVLYSTEDWTNKNVIVTIKANKEIQPVSGFELSDNKKELKREVFENEENILKIKDLYENCIEVEYSVENIDKIEPQGKLFENEDGSKRFEYYDNGEIKNIFVDKYDDKLVIKTYNNFWDAANYYGIDKTDSSITLHITAHPQNSKNYAYYINDKLYIVSNEKNFTFTKLKKGTLYRFKVEALDKEGKVLQTQEIECKTSYFKNIESHKSENNFYAGLNNLDKSVSNVKYAVWNYNSKDNVKWFDGKVDGNNCKIELKKENDKYYPFYGMHLYLYDDKNNVLDVIEFSIDFNTNFDKKEENIDLNNLTEKRKISNNNN